MQISSFLATNGGAHPADKWADLTTETIMDLLVEGDPDSVTPEALAARQAKRDLRPKLFAIFNDHHDSVQTHEQGNLAKVNKSQVGAHIDLSKHLPTVMDKLNDVLAATPWAAHFAQPQVKQVLTQIVGNHSATVMDIERRWHHDRLQAAKGA